MKLNYKVLLEKLLFLTTISILFIRNYSYKKEYSFPFRDTVLSFKVHRITVGRGGVKAVRVAENGAQPPRTRVVIDLTEKCDYELHNLTHGVVLTVYCKATPHQAG